MSALERVVEATGLALRKVSPEARLRAQRSTKWRVRALVRLLKMGALMAASVIVIPLTMVAGGLLLGPSGYEGLLATPLAVFTAWGAILYWGLRPRVTARKIHRADVSALPEHVEEWLERQRPSLPAEAQVPLESLAQRLETLRPQAEGLAARSAGGVSLRRLLVEELTDLVQSYQKLPAPLRNQPLHGGASPAQRLVEGLRTVDAELGRLQNRLAADDLHSLATQQRYLELKYQGDDQDRSGQD